MSALPMMMPLAEPIYFLVQTAVGNNFNGTDIGHLFMVAGGQNQPIRMP